MTLKVCLALLGVPLWVAAQTPDRLKVPFRDPSRPGSVRVNLIRGSISVKGYEGQEVIVEAIPQKRGEPKAAPDPPGMRRVHAGSSGLTVEEENNAMRVSANSGRRVDLVLQVPLKTSLKLTAVHGEAVTVENVDGDIEVSNIHGSVTLTGVGGAAVAHALHGNVKAAFARVDPSKPMSFTSLHGNIDLTLPAATKADLEMQTDRGEAWSDFDVSIGPSTAKVEEDKREGKAKYRITYGSHVTGRINGGGSKMVLKTMHGNLYIRKGK